MHIPHYWAVYVHDGRRPFSKQSYMVWWRNPKKDPRLRGGVTPKRANQLRRLTPDQWRDALDERKEWIENGGDPYDAPVIITKVIKNATPARLFFANESGGGMHRFVDQANRLGAPEFSKHVMETLGEDFLDSESAIAQL